jgi:uncharacterized membrane protein
MIAVDPYLVDWLDLVLRWLHVIAGIVWIGTSFYFVALDNHLDPPKRPADAEAGVAGESWEIHGGGFYLVQKFKVAPKELPEPLHWFKWEAYTTWLSGFALFCVLYYVDASLNLIDADLSEGWGIAISIALLAVAWLVYDGLCRVLRNELALAGVLIALVTVTAYGLSLVYTDRAVWLQLGAMLGTIMAANVLFVIIPAHWDLIRAKEAGREPDPEAGARGKQRSVHNNYLTLPVLVAMLGGHFVFAYGYEDGWLVLVCLMLVGAWIRVFFNLRHAGRTIWWIPVTAAAALAAIAVWIRPPDAGSASAGPPVTIAQVEQIVDRRCLTCHSGASPPKGIRLETPEEIAAQADAIEKVAVLTKVMPLGNATKMTDAERELLGRWIREGAQVRNSNQTKP